MYNFNTKQILDVYVRVVVVVVGMIMPLSYLFALKPLVDQIQSICAISIVVKILWVSYGLIEHILATSSQNHLGEGTRDGQQYMDMEIDRRSTI